MFCCSVHSVSVVVKVRGILFSAAIRWKGELCSVFGIAFSVSTLAVDMMT